MITFAYEDFCPNERGSLPQLSLFSQFKSKFTKNTLIFCKIYQQHIKRGPKHKKGP